MQKKKGISLIVLVITIIVMIVLAGAIILSLNNSGIIGKANMAVSDTDEATVKEIAQMAWAEAYADGVRTVEGENGFKAKVTGTLTTNEVDTSKYLLNITEKGVTVKLKTKAWIQDGLTVKKGNDVLNIGQTINYNATGTDYEGKVWQVLGADADGNLLIMSATDVIEEYRLGYESTDITLEDRMEECQKDWLNGTVKLDRVCAKYGNGTGAIAARSITVEDIDKVTKYDKTTYEEGSLCQYGNIVTYIYNGTIKPAYKATNNVSGELTTNYTNGFYYYDGNTFRHVAVDQLTNEANIGKTIATLTSNYYYYIGASKLDNTTDAYKMLFGATGGYNDYWLASPYVVTNTDDAGFGMYIVYDGKVISGGLLFSRGDTNTPTRGVRAVVTISSEVETASLTQ